MTTKGSRTGSRVRHRKAAQIAALVAAHLFLAVAPAQAQTPPGDPPGNNGTLKIVAGDLSEPDPDNQPQLDGCLVWLQFFGYDLNQQAIITFQAIPPTGEAQLLSHTAVISDDPAGGGQDLDATLSYNLSAALNGLTADPDRGYHITVTSDTVGAPGGAKQKVFWMRCGATPPGVLRVSKSIEGAGVGPFTFALRCNHAPLDRTFVLAKDESLNVADVPSGTFCVVSETSNGGATATRIAETPPDGAEDGRVQVSGAGAVRTVRFTNVFPAGAVGAAGTERVPGGILPETGPGVGTALAGVAGLSLVVLGGLLVRRGRRPHARLSG